MIFMKEQFFKGPLGLMSAIFCLFSFSILLDVYFIYNSSSQSQEYGKYIEGFIFLSGMVCFIINVRLYFRKERLKINHAQEIAKIMTEKESLLRHSIESVKNFESILDIHFKVWLLSDAEKAVAVQLLKGFTSKEISEQRFVSEKTVRNQSHSIYTKSGLSGKQELAAYFLKEFLVSKV